jgi:hypothetical protein
VHIHTTVYLLKLSRAACSSDQFSIFRHFFFTWGRCNRNWRISNVRFTNYHAILNLLRVKSSSVSSSQCVSAWWIPCAYSSALINRYDMSDELIVCHGLMYEDDGRRLGALCLLRPLLHSLRVLINVCWVLFVLVWCRNAADCSLACAADL